MSKQQLAGKKTKVSKDTHKSERHLPVDQKKTHKAKTPTKGKPKSKGKDVAQKKLKRKVAPAKKATHTNALGNKNVEAIECKPNEIHFDVAQWKSQIHFAFDGENGGSPRALVKIKAVEGVRVEDVGVGLHWMREDGAYGGWISDKTPSRLDGAEDWLQTDFALEEIRVKLSDEAKRIFVVVYFAPGREYDKAWFKTEMEDALSCGLLLDLPTAEQPKEQVINPASKNIQFDSNQWKSQIQFRLDMVNAEGPQVLVKIRSVDGVEIKDVGVGLHWMREDGEYGGWISDKSPSQLDGAEDWLLARFALGEIRSRMPAESSRIFAVVFFAPDRDYEKAWFKLEMADALDCGIVLDLPPVATVAAGGGVDLYLSHNPYRIATEFRMNGRNCEEPWFTALSCSDGSPTRLQMWIGQFFDRLHEACLGVRKFYLTYKGTVSDCRDVVEEAARAAERLGIEINVTEVSCGDPGDKFKQLKDLYDKAIKGPYEDFHKLELNGDFRKVEDRLLQVAIMATMKNGKSTLLNAILGQDLQPSATQRCTQLISYIEHCAGMKGFEAKCVDVHGKTSEYLPCDKADLEQWNKDEDVRNVWIRGEFSRIRVGDYRLQFVDTPGPNSATHPEDEVTIDHFLSDNSLPMVCYIVDILDDDEADYLKKIQKHMSQFGKQSEDRFIFIVTKMDQLKIAKGETKEHNQYKNKIDDIKAGLMRIAGISNPRIFPVSAWLALKARSYAALDVEEQEEVVDDVKKFRRALKRAGTTLLDYTSVSSAIRNRIEAETRTLERKVDDDTDELADQLRLAELQSGIPALEMAIEEYATKYSVPARIYDAATVFNEGIQKANAVELLAGEMAAQKTSLDKINQNIEQLNFFLSQGPAAQEMRTKAFPEVWQESQTLIDELTEAEGRFDAQIQAELKNWNPQLDANDNMKPDEACRLANGFVEFLNMLSTNMLRVYTGSVEDDAHKGFKKLQADYKSKLETILGDMPQELTDFLKRVPVLSPIESKKIDTQPLIEKSYEEYKHRYSRSITVEKDGVLRKLWSVMPFTDTEVWVEETRKREVKFVSYSKLKQRVKADASRVLQAGLDRALSAAAAMYADLRRLMMGQFDRFDARLAEFRDDLNKKLVDKRGKNEELARYRGTLDWVREFQQDLGHILDLEA